MRHDSFTISGGDGATIAAYRWIADAGDPRGVVQICHGACEHAGRYARVAKRLVDAGFAVYATDHRGHGRTGAEFGRLGIARPGGWSAIVDDVHRMTQRIAQAHPGLPIVLFGHSMGSILAQGFIQHWGGEIDALVLSGTTGDAGVDEEAMSLVTALGEGESADQPSELFAAMFEGFNQPFSGEDATGFEWLSRDQAEVELYVNHPWCGHQLSNGFVADMLAGVTAIWAPEADARIPRDLPVLVISGSEDPAGGTDLQAVHSLVERYRHLGAGPVTVKIYQGARHEVLNETNRDEVESDLVAWIDAAVG